MPPPSLERVCRPANLAIEERAEAQQHQTYFQGDFRHILAAMGFLFGATASGQTKSSHTLYVVGGWWGEECNTKFLRDDGHYNFSTVILP